MEDKIDKNMDIKKTISKWWNGEVYKNEPSSEIIFLGKIHTKSSIQAHKIYDYIRKEYKFLIATIIAVLAIVVTIISYN